MHEEEGSRGWGIWKDTYLDDKRMRMRMNAYQRKTRKICIYEMRRRPRV
jgi:hypothetical protein